jgi:hypothetical protein
MLLHSGRSQSLYRRVSSSGIWRRVVRCVWTVGLIFSYWRANGNRAPVSYLPSVSCINPDFRLADYCACHPLACRFSAKLVSSTLKMEAICSSETSVNTQRTTRRYIPEDDTLHDHRCGNLKSYNLTFDKRICLFRTTAFDGIWAHHLRKPNFGQWDWYSFSCGRFSSWWLWLPEYFHLPSYFDIPKIDIS